MTRGEMVSGERRTRARRRVPSTGAWISGVLISLLACGNNGEPPSTQALLTDSAGVAIVTSPPGAATYAAVAPEPALSIGVLDGPDEEIFGRIASVARDDAGRFIVADGQVGEIRLFDAGGDHLRTWGGAGDGPGEFRTLAGAWPTPEGVIVAVDSRLDRITRFTPDGGLLTTATFSGLGGQASSRPLRLAGRNAVLSRARSLPPMPGDVDLRDALAALSNPLGNQPEYIVRHDLTGALIDTVATVPARATQTSGEGSGTGMTIQIMRIPFSADATATASPEGRVAVTTSRAYELSLYGPDGTLERIVRLAEEPPVRTEAHLEAWVRAASGGRETPDAAEIEAAVRRYEEMPLPERLPAWTSLLIAANGEIWAGRFAIRGAETVHWDVFGADGSARGHVTIPARFRLQHVGDGGLTVVSTDDLGVERVEVYALHRP